MEGQPEASEAPLELAASATKAAVRGAAEGLEAALAALYDIFGSLLDGSLKVGTVVAGLTYWGTVHRVQIVAAGLEPALGCAAHNTLGGLQPERRSLRECC